MVHRDITLGLTLKEKETNLTTSSYLGTWQWCIYLWGQASIIKQYHYFPFLHRTHNIWKDYSPSCLHDPQWWSTSPEVSLIKRVRRIQTKSVHTHNSWKMVCAKKILIFKTVHTYTCSQCSLYRSQVTWKCAHLDQPHIPPCVRPHSAWNGQCKAGHEYW